jgi:hypothetical protein
LCPDEFPLWENANTNKFRHANREDFQRRHILVVRDAASSEDV